MENNYQVISSKFLGHDSFENNELFTYELTFNKSLEHTGRWKGIEDGLNRYVEMENNEEKEYIVCSCLNYKGIKVSGRRMGECINTIRAFVPQPDMKEIFDNQGFITSTGRFVTREEAWVIAKENNQIKYEIIKDFGKSKPFLMSINLFKD